MWVQVKRGLINLDQASVLTVTRPSNQGEWMVAVRMPGRDPDELLPLTTGLQEHVARNIYAEILAALASGQPMYRVPDEHAYQALL